MTKSTDKVEGKIAIKGIGICVPGQLVNAFAHCQEDNFLDFFPSREDAEAARELLETHARVYDISNAPLYQLTKIK
jgi:hypothetical protein